MMVVTDLSVAMEIIPHRQVDTILTSVGIFASTTHGLTYSPIRTLYPFIPQETLVRHPKALEKVIDISVVKPYPKGDEKCWLDGDFRPLMKNTRLIDHHR
jgi:hypothetical protein